MPEPTQPRILICDELHPAALEVFKNRGLEPEIRTGMNEGELIRTAATADAVIVRSATRVTRGVIEAAERLRVIGRAGIGVDNIDCEAATEHGVVVMNTPTGNATTTAELAIALMLSLARHIPRADRRVRSGKWSKKGLMGSEITGKILGVVGLGRIGRIVAERARGLGMQVVAFDPYLDRDAPAISGSGIELLELDELLGRADFITLHVPRTKATERLISWERLAKVKPGARLINAARGGIVDEEAVLDALADGRLAGAAFDVFEEEPPPADHPLLQREDVIFTPHLGASSTEAQLRVAVDMAEQIADFLTEGVARNAVNAPTLPSDALGEFAPFLLLADKMGSFLAQRMGGPIRKIELTVGGEIARLGTEHLRLALLVGILRHTMEAGVNFVNAPNLAKERGILVLENSQEEANFVHGEITVRAAERAGAASHLVSGTVFGREPRITRIDKISLDLPPRGPMILTRHEDRPGVLGKIGTLLGEQGVNIRRLELGPPGESDDGLAYGFLTLYEDAPAETIAAIAQMEAIREVQLIRF